MKGKMMTRLDLEAFFDIEDYEMSQYRFLYCIKNYKREFKNYKLYPGLTELSELNLALKDFERRDFPGDFHSRQVFKNEFNFQLERIKNLEIKDASSEKVYDFMDWARPYIKETVDEGRVIYDFVKRGFTIEEIGDTHARMDEGFFLVPSNITSTFELFEYTISYNNEAVQKRFLNAMHIISIPKTELEKSTVNVIVELFKKYKNMHKSTFFVCNTELDFPFYETILPIAKRKLISRII
jgi:hypothetical protein